MSTSSNVPSLTSWTQTRFASLYELPQTSSDSDLRTIFGSTFNSNPEILVNYSSITSDGLRDDIAKRGFATTKATVEWKDIIEVPAEEGENAHQAGIVAGSLVITRFLKFRIRAALAQTMTYIVFHAKIEQDPSAQPDEYGDRRRITHMFQTRLDKAPPIHFQNPTITKV